MLKREGIKKIVIVQTAFIGDVILVTPLIRETKNLFPSAKIDVIVIPQTKSILDNNPNIDKIILFNKRENKLKASIQLLINLKRGKYDLAITPHSSLTTALLIFLSRIPIRIGFNRWVARFLLTHKVEHIKNTFKIKKNLNLLSPFTDKELNIQTELFPDESTKQKARRIIDELSGDDQIIIAMAPGSNWFTKRWPIQYYEELAKKLSELGVGIVFIGSKEEKELCEKILPPKNSINLAGELSLLESAAVINLCNLMVCNDSGAMHLANAMQTDVFVFFGPTVEKIGYFPFRKSDYVFQLDMECRPCSSHGTKECPLKHFECMRNIKPDTVLNKIKSKFNIK